MNNKYIIKNYKIFLFSDFVLEIFILKNKLNISKIS